MDIKSINKILIDHSHDYDVYAAESTARLAHITTFKPVPIKPREVEEYEAIPREIRRTLVREYLSERPVIMAYYNARYETLLENLVEYKWLLYCRTLLLGNEELVGEIDRTLAGVSSDVLYRGVEVEFKTPKKERRDA